MFFVLFFRRSMKASRKDTTSLLRHVETTTGNKAVKN